METFFGLLLIGMLLIPFFLAFRNGYNEEGKRRALALSDVDNMGGLEFEHYVADLMRNEGFIRVSVTKASGEFGTDIVATKGGHKYSVQVKRYKNNVNRKAVSDAVGAMKHYGCNAAMVVTNRYMTKQGRMFAQSVGCVIVDRDILGNWISRFQLAGQPRTGLPAKEPEAELKPATPQARMATVDLGSAPLDRTFMPGREGVPEAVFRKITAAVRKRWPRDEEMRDWTLEQEIDAYRELDALRAPDLPDTTFATLRRSAAKSHPDEYSTQLHVVKNQLEAYAELKLLPWQESGMSGDEYGSLCQEIDQTHPFDYSLHVFLLKKQVDAFKKLKSLGGADFSVSPATFGWKSHEVRRKYPNDYVTQYETLTSELVGHIDKNGTSSLQN